MSFAFQNQNAILKAEKDIENVISRGVNRLADYVDWYFDIEDPIAPEIEQWLCERYNVNKHHWGYRIYLTDPPEHILKAIITMPKLERMALKPLQKTRTIGSFIGCLIDTVSRIDTVCDSSWIALWLFSSFAIYLVL